jgi:hypothetical protein
MAASAITPPLRPPLRAAEDEEQDDADQATRRSMPPTATKSTGLRRSLDRLGFTRDRRAWSRETADETLS